MNQLKTSKKAAQLPNLLANTGNDGSSNAQIILDLHELYRVCLQDHSLNAQVDIQHHEQFQLPSRVFRLNNKAPGGTCVPPLVSLDWPE
jgi:hypothetical protein